MPALKCGSKIIECEGVIFDKDGTLIDSFKIWPNLIKVRVKILQREIGFDNEMARLLEKTMGLEEGGDYSSESHRRRVAGANSSSSSYHTLCI